MSNLADSLYKVISNEANNQLSQYQADKTISGEIFSIVDAAKGEYKVRYQDGVWSAFSQGKTKYKIGDNVLVKIPLGDFSKTKYIEGYTYNSDIDTGNDASQIEESFSPDWSVIYEKNWTGEMGLIAYDGTEHKSEIVLFAADGETSDTVFQQYANRGTEFRISAEFMTTFIDAKTTGNYGLRLTFAMSKENSPEVTYTLDTTVFNGDPYRNSYWAPQTILLTVPKRYLTGLRKIVFFQEGFTDYDPQGNSTQPNIYCRNFKAEWIDIKDLTDASYYLTVATPQGMVFTDNYSSLTLQVKLMSGNESLMSKSSCSCFWYAEDPGILISDEDYEKVAGVGWRRIYKDQFDTITVSRSDCPAVTTNFKVVVIYNEDKILSKEISLINLKSQYDLYLDLINDTQLSIKDRKKDNITVTGQWYIELPDTTRAVISETRSTIIDLSKYLSYPWIKVYCKVYDGSAIVGVLNWTNYRSNEDEDLPNFVLQYEGDDVFHYDANGDIYDMSEYDDIEHILKCNIVSAQTESLTFTMKWLDSDKRPITTAQEPQDSMLRAIWVDNSDNSLHFKVRTRFYNTLTNNSVYVRLTSLDGSYVDYEKEITFLKDGDQGTNGTSYVCLIRPIVSIDNENKKLDKVAFKYKDGDWVNEQIPVKAFIYANGELINNNSNYTINYIWESKNIEIATAGAGIQHKINLKPTSYNTKCRYAAGTVRTNTGSIKYSPEKQTGFFIKVQADIKCDNQEKTSVYAYYPLDVIVGNIDLAKVEYIAPSYIKYSSSGVNPQYGNGQLSFAYNGTQGTIGSLSSKLNIWNNYLYPASHWIGDQFSVRMLKMNVKDSSTDYLLHSIFMYLNPYGNEAINSWDGTSISLADNKGIILAPQIGAGTKNDENEFSGVVMGKDSTQDKTGLYGYENGINTFALMEDGKAIFGTKKQITIDGENAQITGKNSGADNGQYMTINLVNLGNGTYAIQIGDKFLVDYEGNLTCTNAAVSGTVNASSGSFTGEINANSGKIGDCTIKNGKLEIKNANITDTIVAGAINLDTATITGTLNAENIDVANIKIKRANIDEKLTANEIDVDNLTVANAVNVTGTINANQINAGTLSADRINAGTLSWDKLIGFAPDTKLSDSNNYLKSLHVTNLYGAIGYLQTLQLVTSGTSGLEESGVLLKPNGIYSKTEDGGTSFLASWTDITSTTKTAIFG